MKLTVHVSRLLIIVLPIVAEIGCAADRNELSNHKDSIQPITSVEQFNSIIENAGNKLVVFNLYADWCMPCHVLAPTLTELATENRSKITIFKVDTDQFPQITAAFGVTGIPFVVFVKNKKAIYALIGVQPKDSYTKIIEAYADSTKENINPAEEKSKAYRLKTVTTIIFFINLPVIMALTSLRSKTFYLIITSKQTPLTSFTNPIRLTPDDDPFPIAFAFYCCTIIQVQPLSISFITLLSTNQ